MRTGWLGTALVLAACGSSPGAIPAPTPTPTPTPASAARPVLALHEWGLLDVDLATGTVELSAGPGRPARPMVARKPVIYAHLLEGDRASVTLDVRIRGGIVLEHWPPAELSEGRIRWTFDVRRGACPGASPARDMPARESGCASADGFCEIGELPRYVTNDHDCMDAGGQTAGLLFYRSTVPADALPLRIERGTEGRVSVTALRELGAGPRTILRVSTGLSGPWPVGHVVITRAELPQGTGTVHLPVGRSAVEPAAERASLERELLALGLTQPEAGAFLDAWVDELFGAEPASARRRPAASLPQDVVLYWLPEADVRAVSELDAGETPVVLRRAFLVRVVLPPVSTA